MIIDSPVRVLQWCFTRGADLLTCAIEVRFGDNAYSVLTIPQWDPLACVTERFVGAVDALQRHAAIARELRENGWRLAAYTE